MKAIEDADSASSCRGCSSHFFLLSTHDLPTFNLIFVISFSRTPRSNASRSQLYGNEYTARITRDGTCVAADYGLVSGCRCPAAVVLRQQHI